MSPFIVEDWCAAYLGRGLCELLCLLVVLGGLLSLRVLTARHVDTPGRGADARPTARQRGQPWRRGGRRMVLQGYYRHCVERLYRRWLLEGLPAAVARTQPEYRWSIPACERRMQRARAMLTRRGVPIPPDCLDVEREVERLTCEHHQKKENAS